jgi:hypothetical protein
MLTNSTTNLHTRKTWQHLPFPLKNLGKLANLADERERKVSRCMKLIPLSLCKQFTQSKSDSSVKAAKEAWRQLEREDWPAANAAKSARTRSNVMEAVNPGTGLASTANVPLGSGAGFFLGLVMRSRQTAKVWGMRCVVAFRQLQP